MFRKIITYLTIYSFMFSNVCWAAMITPDGRTQTTVNVNGHVYDVTTSTVSGQNAFNSFSNFDVYKGTTVNLYLPGSTLNLINLVRDGKTNIDGILNSIKNGKIGGNVFILNPHGIAIGKSGVVNVGSLMLSTPNKEFMDQVIGQDGSISELATKSVLAGDLPINPAGVISVKGKIKALDSVAVRAGGVVNAGEILANLKPTQASDIVNTGGLDIDAPLAFKDGKIGVFAENDVVNAGTIKADAGGSGKAGGIVVKAGGNISLRKGSLISAKGAAEHKDGGSVVVFADNKADLEKGAEIAADAYDGSAKGGFVELSALKEVNLNGGTMTAGGRDGMIFIDPEILNITSDSAYKGQDNIYAIANTVNVKQGVSLVKENGDITLIARDTDAGWVKKSGAFLNIEDNATLKGDNIYLYALAGDAEVLDGIVTGEVTEDNGSSALTAIGETLKAKGLEFFEALTDSGLFVGYSKSEAEAGINIGKNVTIAAKEDVKINSKVVSNSEVDTLGTGIDVTVAENSAASGVFIDSGVNISGKNVAITSEIDSTTSAEATTSAYGSGRGVPVDIAVAVGLTDTDNKIDIKNGASITATDKLEIAADTRKSHNVAAEGLAYQDGWAAAGVAYSESESSSSVTVGGTIKGGTVNITSDIEAVKNASSAKTVVGNGIFDRLNVWAGNKMLDGLSKWITAIPAQTHSQSNVKLAMSGAVSYSKHNNSSNVKIANNYGEGQTAADTPKTTVTGDKVTIGSHVMDVITNGASASVSPKTNDKDHSQDQNKENSFAGAVGYGVYDNTSRAEIGAGVAVNASQSLELTSETEEPVLWPDASILNVFDGLAGNVLEKGEALLTNIEKYLEDNPMSFYTSLVKSSANTSSGDANPGEEKNGIVGIAGSVNLMEFNNKSDAVIADGAEINQLYNPNNAGYTRLDKAPAVKVSADSYVETFNMSGEYGGAAKFGLGGSYLQTWYDSKVNAIIGDNVKLYAGDLDVNASATHRNLSIAGTAGYKKSDTFGFQGTFDWLKSNSDVLAQISNQADVLVEKADEKSGVTVNAESENSFVNIAGAVSINEIGNRTAAYVSNSKVNGGKFVSADNVEIKAESGADIFALAGNISAAGTGGVGASVAVNEIDNTTESYAKNADIEAEKGNISITAQNTSEIETSSAGVGYGGKASVSGSVSVNNINNRTYGYADNSGLTAYGSVLLKSIAKSVINFYGGMIALSTKGVGGGGTVGTSSVSEDTLAEIRNNSEIKAYGNKPAEDGTTGVGVAAENDSIVNMYGVNAGLGKAAGIGANVAVSQVNNSAVARIDNAKINQDLSGGNDEKYAVNQEVNVSAANKTQLETHAGTLAGGTVGVGLSSVTTLVENTTKAEIVNGSNVKSKGDIGVNTDAKTYFNSVVVGGAGGKVGVAGNVNVAEIGNHNRALVDASTIAGYGSMTVAAKDVTRLGKRLKDDGTEEDFAVALGAGGVGLYNGTGASVLVSDIANDTTAKIGNSSVDVAKKLSLTADSDSSILSYVFAAGLGAYSGVAGSVAVNTIDNTTEAFITEDEGKTTEINQNMSNASQDVKIAASADAAIENLLGSAAVGLGSGGASVDVSTIDGRTSAGTIGSLALSAGRNVDITADSVRDISVEGIAGSGGAGTLSGAISVIRVGSNYTADMQEQTAGVLETVNAEIARNNEYQDSLNINGLPTDIDLSEFDRDVNKEFSTSVSKDVGTSAYVGSGATVKAGGNIAVAATDDVHTRNLTGEMAAGGVSAGASVGITDIRNAAKAYIAGNTLVASGKDFSLSALTKTDVDSKSMGGVIATMFAAGGSVVHVNADSHAQAYVGNGAVVNAGNVTMEAEDESDIEALAAGVEASVGGAAGASVAIVNKTNDVRAFVADGAKVTADSFEGSAKDDVSVDVQAIAGAAGVVSGEGAYAESSIVSKLKSYVGDAVFKLAEGFRMFTSGSSHGNAGALGVNAGVLSVGASVAKSDIDLDNQAVVDGSAEIAAADVYVGAGQLKADAVTDSLAAAGALIGGNGAQSSAGVGGKVLAKVEDGAKFTGAGNVEILSMSNSGQAAVSSAYRGGILAAGATLADAAGHLDTITEIGAIDLTADKLTAKAEATDILYAETVSGSGGVISGAAAISGTKNDAETKVTIGTDGKDGHFDLEALEVLASRSVKQNGTADSVNASVVGASGARVDNVSNAVTAVDIKGNAEFAVNDVNVKAINTYDKNGKFAYNGSGWSESGVDYNIQSGSGGVVDAPAVISKTVIDNEATVDFGADTVFSRNVARKEKEKDYQFAVSALNDVKATDKAKLVSGGVLAIADTVSSIDNRKNKAAVNLKGSIASIDDLILTANSNANLNSEVYVNTYGASGVAMGSSTVRTTSDNSVNFADGSRTMSYGDLHVYAGQAYEDYSGNNTLHSRVYLWNNTALPFSDPEVEATIVMNNLINIDSGAVVKSGRDINLTSNMGIAVADGFSSAKNPYNELLSLEGKSFNGTVDNNSRIVVNGTAEAGVNNIQKFIIDENGRVKVTIGEETFYDDDQLYHKKTGEKLYSNIIDEINRMKNLRAEYIEDKDAVAYYDAEIAALQAKLTLMGLYSENGGTVNTTVDYITLGDIYAQPGAISLNTQSMEGTGLMSVTSDAAVTIENKSSSFLRVSDITIPEGSGGTVKLNGAAVTGDIGSLKVHIAEKTMESPTVTITSDIAANDGRAPNIDIDGTVTNYGGLVKVNNAAGSIYVNGTIHGKDLNITAGRDIYQGYTNGFRHIGGSPEAAWDAIASGNESGHLTDGSATASSNADIDDSRSSLVADNNIFLSGRYINLNGLVQSGTTDYNLDIPDGEIQLAGGLTSETALADYNRNKQYNYNASPLYKLSDKYGNVDAYYNAVTGQIELADVRVEGGYVESYGHILNTSQNSGEIMVTDGYGRVNINNRSGREIVVNNMSLSNRISGVIKITDLAKKNAAGEYLQTTYTRNGNTITVADNNGGSKDINAVQDENGKSSTAYSPLENQRYVWQTGQKTVSETTKTYEGDSFWGMDWLVPDTGEGVTVTGPTPVGDPVKMEDGERIEISSSDNKYEYEKDSYVSSEDKLIYHNVEEWSEGWWIFSVDKYKTTDIYQKGETHINTHSVKADYDIKISFKGYDSALADIVSKSDITLNGVINNRSGTTNITTEGAIKVGSDYARILGDGLNLTANNGIGSNGTALAVDVAGGNLNVVNKVSGDVNLKSAGSDFVFNSIVNNGGNTSVNAAGSIFGASADSLISGGKISLTAQTGSIGTDDTALKIQTSGDEDSALTVLANNNVNLVQEEGDLGLESVVSLAGDVNVKVENGSVFDANTNEVYDDKTVEQLTKIWDDMGLDVGNEQMKEAFLNGKKAEYNAYWQYKSRQPEGGEPEFRFTAAEREALLNKELNESEKQALGMDKITDEYINRLEAEKTAEYKKLAAVYGDEGKYGSSYDAGWTYRLSEAEEAELAEGAGWNKSQLAYSIFKAKEGEVVDTQYMIEDPNVVGKNVTIEANGSIGQDTGSETFKLSELSPETDVDKILLIASAERDNLEIAEDGDTVTVHKREDVDIHADSITLKARDYIYLGGEEDINVNTVEAGEGQKITIAGAKGIYNVATEADHANVIGGDLVLEAADGSIGTEDKALNLKLADGAKVTARSQNDIFLNSTGGDLVAESLLAKDGVLSLTADGSLIAGTLKEGEIVNLQGQSIVVNAENVGDEDNYLTVALGDKENEEHTLTLNVAGDANVNNLGAQELAVESSAVGGTLRLKSASSLIGATADSLLSAAALEFNGVGGDIGAAGRYLNVSTERLTASADGSIYLNNVRSAVFEGVNAGREIEITSAADLTLSDATAGGSVKVNGAGSLFANNLRAGGDLLMTAENDLDVSGATAEGSVTLVSRLGDMVAELIGSGGDMKIDAAGNLTAGNINAGEKVSIAADSADLDEVVSGGDMRIAVNSDNIFGRLTSEKGNIALTVENADANLRGSVKAANGRVTVTAGGSVLNAGAPAEGAIIANTVDLTAKNGSIGTSGNYLTVDSSYTEPGWISALAEKGIFISEVNGDMNVRRFASNGDIDMRVESSIMAAPGMDPEVPNFKADNITLHTNGSIGMPDNRLVLALNDNGRGKINLKAETGIAVNKLGDGLVSDYVYNLQSGKVMIGLPSGHANIARVTAVGGFELYVREHTDFYNIWLSISDLEARMMNPPYTEYPSENPIEIMRAPLLDRYKLQTGDGLFMNIGSLTGEEEKLSVGF